MKAKAEKRLSGTKPEYHDRLSLKKTRRSIRVSKAKGEMIVEIRRKGISYPRIAKELGLRVGGVRSFLRRKGRTSKQRIRPISAETLKELYCGQGLSMEKIGEKIGLPHSNVEYWMTKHKIARRPLRKHERYPFSGDDCEKAYMIGFRQGDLHAMREGLVASGSVEGLHIPPRFACSKESLRSTGMFTSVRSTTENVSSIHGKWSSYSTILSHSFCQNLVRFQAG